jgi:hypothetical protein
MPLYPFARRMDFWIVFYIDLRLDAGLHAGRLSTHAQQQLKQLARSRALPVDPSQHTVNILMRFQLMRF